MTDAAEAEISERQRTKAMDGGQAENSLKRMVKRQAALLYEAQREVVALSKSGEKMCAIDFLWQCR